MAVIETSEGSLGHEPTVLKGKESTLRVTCDHERKSPSGTPLICCSATRGFVRLTGFTNADPRKEGILALAEWISDNKDGAYVAVIPPVSQSPGLVLIQADHNSRGDETFYQRVHGDSRGRWRDFYF